MRIFCFLKICRIFAYSKLVSRQSGFGLSPNEANPDVRRAAELFDAALFRLWIEYGPIRHGGALPPRVGDWPGAAHAPPIGSDARRLAHRDPRSAREGSWNLVGADTF